MDGLQKPLIINRRKRIFCEMNRNSLKTKTKDIEDLVYDTQTSIYIIHFHTNLI